MTHMGELGDMLGEHYVGQPDEEDDEDDVDSE
jgi:hypothetical protein